MLVKGSFAIFKPKIDPIQNVLKTGGSTKVGSPDGQGHTSKMFTTRELILRNVVPDSGSCGGKCQKRGPRGFVFDRARSSEPIRKKKKKKEGCLQRKRTTIEKSVARKEGKSVSWGGGVAAENDNSRGYVNEPFWGGVKRKEKRRWWGVHEGDENHIWTITLIGREKAGKRGKCDTGSKRLLPSALPFERIPIVSGREKESRESVGEL